MVPVTKQLKTYYAKDRKTWRQWLEKNHHSSPGVWLIYYKKQSGKTRVPYDDAVEEALCFGWIDSTTRPLDEKRYMQRFTPRKTKSIWSVLNKNRVEKLIKDGSMMPAGLSKIEDAKKNGSWYKLDATNKAVETKKLLPDLEKALSKNKKASVNFKAFPPGCRRQFLWWIDNAKLPETRLARIRQTVLMAAANKKPGIKGFKL